MEKGNARRIAKPRVPGEVGEQNEVVRAPITNVFPDSDKVDVRKLGLAENVLNQITVTYFFKLILTLPAQSAMTEIWKNQDTHKE